jgi:hypothetical protein
MIIQIPCKGIPRSEQTKDLQNDQTAEEGAAVRTSVHARWDVNRIARAAESHELMCQSNILDSPKWFRQNGASSPKNRKCTQPETNRL